MSKIWKIAGLVGLFVLVFGVAGLVYAQTESPQPYTRPGYGPGMMGGRGGFGGGMYIGEEGPYHEVMMGSFAEALGMSIEQLEERLADGETMWQIAESEGFTWEEFVALMQAARTAMVEEDGHLTQERAGFMNWNNMHRGFGWGFDDCMGYEQVDPQGFHRGPGGRWSAP